MDSMMQAIADAVVNRLMPLLTSRSVEPRLLTIQQGSVYIGRTETATRQLIAKGVLATVRSDTRVMLDRQDLDLWIDQSKN